MKLTEYADIQPLIAVIILFLDIFAFELEEIFKIFLQRLSDAISLNIMLEKAIQFKDEFYDQSIVSKIRGKLEALMKSRLTNSRNCLEALQCLSGILNSYPNEILNAIFADLRIWQRHGNLMEQMINKFTNFSEEPAILAEEIDIYVNLPLESIFKENEINSIKKREQKLNFEKYFLIYNH